MNTTSSIANKFAKRYGQIAILIDPEKSKDKHQLNELIKKAQFAEVDYLFVGGSTVTHEDFISTVSYLKKNSTIPVVIFPGASHQISNKADALLYLSLISGRNPEYLIGKHVASISKLKSTNLEVLSTGYILIESGKVTAVEKVTGTKPIMRNNLHNIIDTAIAGQLLGMKLIYLEAGSGAKYGLTKEIIKKMCLNSNYTYDDSKLKMFLKW